MFNFKKFKIDTRSKHIWIRGVLLFETAGLLCWNLLHYIFIGDITISSVTAGFIVLLPAGYVFGVRTWKPASEKHSCRNCK